MTQISFIGGGNMASAMLAGLREQAFEMSSITVVEPSPEKRQLLGSQFGVHTTDQLPSVVQADVIVLAVKPQQLRDVCIFLGSLLQQQLVISIAAGIRTETISRWLGGYTTLVRVMPNTPAQIQAGISGLFATRSVSSEQRETSSRIMASAGKTVWVDAEDDLDAVTAISGSGPAYVFYFIEAMQEAALALGLSEAQAQQLSLQTFLGASQLAAQSPLSPAALRAQVTSKGGTTEQALLSLESSGIKEAITRAAKAAADRSKELGDMLGKE